MTGLHRTDLTATLKSEFAAKALALQGCYGSVTELSQTYRVSRNTVYAAGDTAEKVLQGHFAKDEEALRAVQVTADETQLRRALLALRIMAPNTIRAIEDLIPILYPGLRVSYGKIQQILSEGEGSAAQYNRSVDLSAIQAGALDEMYSQGDPVLAGVDLDRGYLFSLKLRDSRSGKDWAEVLTEGKEQGLSLSVVVKDAALGIAAGVSEVFPQAEQRDDCFHALYEMNKVRVRLERRAYGAIAREIEAECKLGKVRAKDREKRDELRRKLVWEQRCCQKALKLHDTFEKAVLQARWAMEFVDLSTGQFQTAQGVQEKLLQAARTMQSLDDAECKRVGKYLENRTPGLTLATAEMETKLELLKETYPEDAVSMACLVWQLVHTLKKNAYPRQRAEFSRLLAGAYARLMQYAGEKTEPLLDSVEKLLVPRHRASSAIEGFNASLRPFLYIQKGVTQGFLELFRAYHNLKVRRWGRHKGTSAYQLLTGAPVNDWLSLLGYPPSSALH